MRSRLYAGILSNVCPVARETTWNKRPARHSVRACPTNEQNGDHCVNGSIMTAKEYKTVMYRKALS